MLKEFMGKGLDDCTYKRGESGWSSSDHLYKMGRKSGETLAFLMLTFLQVALASDDVEIKPSINPAVVGDTLTLSLSPATSFKSGSWAVGESQILTWLGEQQAVFPSHNGRASVNVLTGVLTLSSVKVADSGVYIVQSTDPQLKANTSITVLEAISNVTLKVTPTSLMEFNSSAVMTCSVSSGSSLTFLWMNGSSDVTASDRVQLTNGSSILTITNVTRYDQGPFKCHTSNPISNGTSGSVNLTIIYGPDNMALTANGQNTTSFPAGSNLTMLCVAQSNPPAQLQWAFRGELVNTSGPLWELMSITKDHSGPYSCLAFNNHTNLNSTITKNILIATPSCGQKIEASQNPLPVGSTVTLTSNASVTTGAWLFDTDFIVFIIPGSFIVSNTWGSRVTFNSNTSSLTIRSLQIQDSGNYELLALNAFSAELTLFVQEPISGVTLKASETSLVEFNDTAVLMCSVSNGSSLSYVWMKDGSVITASEAVQFSDGGATLTITNVTRHYGGQFKCNVSNLLGSEVSAPVNLNISYGPSDATMTIMPVGYNHRTGSNITLSCSADSNPSAGIQWMVDGMLWANHVGPQLQLKMVTESDSGNYKCLFHNTVTMRFSSASAMIRIVKPLGAVHVNNTGGPAILGEALTLHCEVTGPVTMIKWWRDMQNISADSSTVLDMDNRTLTLNPVQLHDGGEYQCEAINEVSKMTSSPFKVEVNYGPMTPEIRGPYMALTGATVMLNCSSDSHPHSDIKWYFNDYLLANTSELTIGPLTLNMSGRYICKAYNSVTGKNNSAYTMLTVYAPVTTSIKAVEAYPIQNHTFTLTCETTGSVDSIIWMHDWFPMSADHRRTLSMDNNTLTFDPVMHYDDGHYQCVAYNPLSNFTSANFTLEVFFGPMMPTIVGPKAATLGENVTFRCDAASNPPSSFMWFFNVSSVASTSEYNTPPLTFEMMGMYTCMAFNNITGKNVTVNTMLAVVYPIIDVRIEMPNQPAIEGHVFMLTCDVTGPAQHVYWMKDGVPLHGDNRTTFSMNNKNVTFNPVYYNDTGKYQCVAFNAAVNKTSPPAMLYVNFGPETPIIKGPSYAEAGQQVYFHCSAHSMPPSHYTWWYNGSEVANTSMFRTSPLTLNMSGEYACRAYNNVTGKNSTNSQMLTVIEAVESLVITHNTIPIQTKNFTLTCEVTGPYDSIYWMKDNVNLSAKAFPDTHMFYYHTEDNMLHFLPLTSNDDGMYQCVASTKALNHLSNPYTLLGNYGPLSMHIIALDSAPIGITMLMKCVTDSRPDCEYIWFHNDLNEPLMAGSILSFPVTNESDGNYICRATNPVTNITLYQAKLFTAHAVGLHTQPKAALMMMGLLALSMNVFFN
ncbi:carcinoembryonic antigen-related cell adhesion molecule 1 [Notolabrus celidotus]|uniref:carcinoembryonic antigen-related cell adhesion molecule 1 n=1 Tax=Notolabrus celidotus TaxID=1203425 RepID=UPI00148F8470|nr:carcinoembryonic antigen-related cell adhesion molecule 1 [Notolabrus celidotus]